MSTKPATMSTATAIAFATASQSSPLIANNRYTTLTTTSSLTTRTIAMDLMSRLDLRQLRRARHRLLPARPRWPRLQLRRRRLRQLLVAMRL